MEPWSVTIVSVYIVHAKLGYVWGMRVCGSVEVSVWECVYLWEWMCVCARMCVCTRVCTHTYHVTSSSLVTVNFPISVGGQHWKPKRRCFMVLLKSWLGGDWKGLVSHLPLFVGSKMEKQTRDPRWGCGGDNQLNENSKNPRLCSNLS